MDLIPADEKVEAARVQGSTPSSASVLHDSPIDRQIVLVFVKCM